MIVIADSGSTKTAWRTIDTDGNIEQFETLGLNPYHSDHAQILSVLNGSPLKPIADKVKQLYFYGSGCGSNEKKREMHGLFSQLLPKTSIEIQDDMLGAARATCNRDKGIACILGTGSNTCYYDGEKIAGNIPSTGYILGDEGSGSHLGKLLLGDFIRGNMPEHILEKLRKRFNLDRDTILENVYRKPQANRYLAQYAKFLFQNLNDPYCATLCTNAFREFFDKYVTRYEGHQSIDVHFVGSVGFYFGDMIRRTAKSYGIRVKNILENPIAGLTLYHQIEVK